MEALQKLPAITDWFPGVERPIVISGPCSAESEEQVLETCMRLKATGKVDMLRAGIWKPRTRPGNFEGIGSIGLKWLQKAKVATGLPTTVEVATAAHVQEALKHGVDVLWIGARTTVNPFSVQEVADALKGVDIPVLIKNPINADLDLWIGAIERIQQAGVTQIGGIHRGFAKYGEKQYRNAPQWQLPIELKRRFPNLPMICDPSHICGNRHMLFEVAQEALDLNFDGVMIESHIDPDNAWSDAKQQVVPERVGEMVNDLVVRNTAPQNGSLSGLSAFRSQIDKYDDEIMALFAQRMEVAQKIGQYKKENNISILQTKRWEEILEKAFSKGRKVGLSDEFIEKYLKAVHQESIDQQNKIMNK
ncbi:chorismate mutase [Fulvivirga lutimaris]|uniref:chorismate mutase n=1 Tax=Fulvivirga lutimaris TaxID=1819566 RepID=UPI0012BC2016|nr:chorismate mutase [Fulvivirga lutimaris]MTI39436.1 3-deoxy-7-phosphoheptulonate synthase [Fulvivirga lutimaris]